jgi:EpsI family protein
MRTPLSRAIAICALMGAATVFIANARKSETAVKRLAFESFPMQIDGWRAVNDPPLDEDVLRVLGADDYVSRVYYRPDGAAVGLFIGFFASQRQGDTIHSPLNCLPGAGWEAVSQGRLVIPAVAGSARTIEINRYVVQKGLERQMVLYWYQSHGRVIASEYTSRFMLINDAIRMNRTDGSMVRVIAPIPHEADGVAAEALAVSFIHSLFPRLNGYLPS